MYTLSEKNAIFPSLTLKKGQSGGNPCINRVYATFYI